MSEFNSNSLTIYYLINLLRQCASNLVKRHFLCILIICSINANAQGKVGPLKEELNIAWAKLLMCELERPNTVHEATWEYVMNYLNEQITAVQEKKTGFASSYNVNFDAYGANFKEVNVIGGFGDALTIAWTPDKRADLIEKNLSNLGLQFTEGEFTNFDGSTMPARVAVNINSSPKTKIYIFDHPPPTSLGFKNAKGGSALLCLQSKNVEYEARPGLSVDAIPGSEMLGVEMFTNDEDTPFFRNARLRPHSTNYQSLSEIPQQVRVIWRQKGIPAQISWGSAIHLDDNGKSISKHGFIPPPFNIANEISRRKQISRTTGIVHYGPWTSGYRDELAGDYTITVASRIPESVYEDIRLKGGELRIKFRLMPDGVLMGWDIRRKGKGKHFYDFEMAGGDFREARIYNGKVDRKGWYIDKNGQKIETDY